MTRRLAAALTVGLTLAFAPAAPAVAADAPGLRLIGGESGLWLLRYDPGEDATTLAARRQGRWSAEHKSSGRARAAAGDGQRLHVFYRNAYVSYPADDLSAGRTEPFSLDWRDVAVLAATFGPVPGRDASELILLVARAPAATQPTTATSGAATQPGEQLLSGPEPTLELLLLGEGEPAESLAVLPGGSDPPGAVYHIAAAGDGVYVAATTEAGQVARILRYNGQWADYEDLTARLAEERMLTLAPGQGELLLAATSEGDGALMLHRLAEGELSEPIALHLDTGPLAPPAEAAATRYGSVVAVVWAKGDALQFAQFEPDGTLVEVGTLDLTAEGEVGFWARVANGVYIAMAVGTMVIWLVWMRSRSREPLDLPSGLQPASRVLRLIAVFLDLTPWVLLAFWVTGAWGVASRLGEEMSGLNPQQIVQQVVDDPRLAEQVIPAGLLGQGLFLVYGIVTEGLLGATLGKLLLRMRVVTDGGKRPDWPQVALRNLTKLIELQLASLVIILPLLLIWPMVTRLRQRLGDVPSRTAVVARRPAMMIAMTEPPEGERPHDVGPIAPPEEPEQDLQDRPGGQQ